MMVMMTVANKVIKYFLKAYLIIGLSSIYTESISQHNNKFDSLIQILNTQSGLVDSVRFEILRELFKDNTLDPDLRLHYATQAYNFSKEIKNLKWQYLSTIDLGHIHKKKGNLDDAFKAFFHGAELAIKTQNKKHEAIALSAIATVYRVEENYKTALHYYNQGISILREVNDSTNLAKSLMNTGELYRVNHILDTALIYFEESGQLFDQLNFKIGNAYNLGNIGLVYAEQGKYKLAEDNLLKASAILEDLGDRYPIAVYNTYMADIYKERGDLNLAFDYAHKSYQIGKEEGLKEQIRDASFKLSELYDELGDYKNAFYFQKEFITYKDSLNNAKTIQQMADLRTEFEVSQKQAEVDLLENEKKIQLILGLALSVVFILVVIISLILYKSNKVKIRSNKLLREQNEELETQRDQLDQLNNTKDRFFAIISHDLRGPVSGINGLVALIKMYIEDKNYDGLDELIRHIDKSSSTLSFLLDNLLSWAVNQQGQFPHHPEDLELKPLIEEIVDIFLDLFRAKDLKVNVEIPDSLKVLADKNSVQTVIRNLISNAIKFTAKGGIITIKGETFGKNVKIKVIDTGVGIPTEKMATLFQLKEKKSTGGTNGEKGMGLGLRLVFEFVEMNNGSIKVNSIENEGTTFTVCLPKLN
ncbi:tetratricopeptide repeat-containing sensor histidine kinase [Chondrinema litorale]|uniref:tetratricopeptide repeat-containing sensor histidine kinase n=1 Tax=Chondrinema litorale TaxID=2994555 RepID=UPI002543828C|nr:tetratricopeptide repeat-containing sensor histidine kinase [Chondrinema litorale]UZR97415.1 tetratricopeptide repeat-containing sensor histidine kinase [Chondrinema litorale]